VENGRAVEEVGRAEVELGRGSDIVPGEADTKLIGLRILPGMCRRL